MWPPAAISSTSMTKSGASPAVATSRARVSAFRCQLTGACRVAPRGEPRPSRLIATFTTTASPSRWCVHDMPQHDNRVELDDKVNDAWGLPVARITNKIHENDLRMGRWIIDHNAEILDAAGAKNVYRVYIDRITGNCSHQHGTTRMGNDPETSVLNKWCQAHEVDNLFVVDGGPFPTATGANPTLTIMANAWRVSAYIADRYKADRKQ